MSWEKELTDSGIIKAIEQIGKDIVKTTTDTVSSSIQEGVEQGTKEGFEQAAKKLKTKKVSTSESMQFDTNVTLTSEQKKQIKQAGKKAGKQAAESFKDAAIEEAKKEIKNNPFEIDESLFTIKSGNARRRKPSTKAVEQLQNAHKQATENDTLKSNSKFVQRYVAAKETGDFNLLKPKDQADMTALYDELISKNENLLNLTERVREEYKKIQGLVEEISVSTSSVQPHQNPVLSGGEQVRSLEQVNAELEKERQNLKQIEEQDKKNEAAIDRLQAKRENYSQEVFHNNKATYDVDKLQEASRKLSSFNAELDKRNQFEEKYLSLAKIIAQNYTGQYGIYNGIYSDLDDFTSSNSAMKELHNLYQNGIKGVSTKEINALFRSVVNELKSAGSSVGSLVSSGDVNSAHVVTEIAEEEKRLLEERQTLYDARQDQLTRINNLQEEQLHLMMQTSQEASSKSVETTHENIQETLKETRQEAEKTAEAIENIGKGKPGNPEQILYHNSDAVFDGFDMSKAGEHGGLLGNGAYFSLTNSDTYSRADFGKYQTQWIANVQNIFDTFVGFTDEEIERIMKQYFSDKSEQIQKELRGALKSINVNAKPSIGTIQELGGVDFGEIVQSLGYDATLREDELAIYDSSKIQRANTSVYNNELKEYIDLTQEATVAAKELNNAQESNQSSVLSGDNSAEKLEQDLKDIYQIIDKIQSEPALREDGIIGEGLYSEKDLQRLINLLKEYDSILGQISNYDDLADSKYFKSSYFNEYMEGVEPNSDAWNNNISSIEEMQAHTVATLVGNIEDILDNATPIIKEKLEEMFTLDLNALRQHFEDYGGLIRNAIGSDAYYDWDEKLFPSTPNQTEVLSGDGVEKSFDKAEEKIESVNEKLQESKKYVNDVRQAFMHVVGRAGDRDALLEQYPELSDFKNRKSVDNARAFLDTDEWNDFLSTLPQAHTYLESIGYDFERIYKLTDEEITWFKGLSSDELFSRGWEMGEAPDKVDYKEIRAAYQAYQKELSNQTPLSSPTPESSKDVEEVKETAEEIDKANEKIEDSNEEVQESEAELEQETEKRRKKSSSVAKENAEETVKANEKVIKSNEKVVESEHRKIIGTTESDNLWSKTYQDESGRTYTEGEKYNKKADKWEPFKKQLTSYTKFESEAIRVINKLADAYADLEKAQRNGATTAELDAHQQLVDLLEEEEKQIRAQADAYFKEQGLGAEYTKQLFDERVSHSTDEHALKLQIKTVQEIRKENEKATQDAKKRNVEIVQANRHLNSQEKIIEHIEMTYNKALNPDLEKSVTNQNDLTELATKKKEIQDLINKLKNAPRDSSNEQDYLNLEKMIASYKDLANYKKKANNPTKGELGGQKLESLISVQINEYQKLINKAKLFGDETETNVKLLEEQLKKIATFDNTSSTWKANPNATADDYYGARDVFKIEKSSISRIEQDLAQKARAATSFDNAFEEAKKVNVELDKTVALMELWKKGSTSNGLSNEFQKVDNDVEKLNTQLKNGAISLSDYKKEIKACTSEYEKMIAIQQKRDFEDYSSNIKEQKEATEQNKKAADAYDALIVSGKRYYELLSKQKSGVGLGIIESRELEDLTKKFYEASEAIGIYAKALNGSSESQQKYDLAQSRYLKDSAQAYLDSIKGDLDKSADKFVQGTANKRALEFVDEYKTKIKELKTAIGNLDNLQSKGTDIVDSDELAEVARLQAQIAELEKQLRRMKNNKEFQVADFDKAYSQMAKISQILEKNTKMSREIRESFNALQSEYQIVIDTKQSQKRLEELNIEFSRMNANLQASGRTGNSFFNLVGKKINGMAAQFFAMYVSFQDLLQVARRGFEVIKEYDKALTEMNKVSKESMSTLKEFQKESFALANSIGTTASQIQNSTADFLRLGEAFDVAKQSAMEANELFKVSEFDSITEATDALISMSQAYSELEKGEITDVLNYVGNNFSSSTEDLAVALQDAAAVLKTQGNDLYQAVSILTAGNAITQDATKTAGGVRTIALRLAGKNIDARTYRNIWALKCAS